jgi:hypothetical protein
MYYNIFISTRKQYEVELPLLVVRSTEWDEGFSHFLTNTLTTKLLVRHSPSLLTVKGLLDKVMKSELPLLASGSFKNVRPAITLSSGIRDTSGLIL